MKKVFIKYTNRQVYVKSCPFCGDYPEIRILGKRSCIIECVNCNAAGLLRKSLAAALNVWNNRIDFFN